MNIKLKILFMTENYLCRPSCTRTTTPCCRAAAKRCAPTWPWRRTRWRRPWIPSPAPPASSRCLRIFTSEGRMLGDPAHRKRVLREMSTQPMKILNIWSFPCKKVSKSKNGFLRNGYLSKTNQGSGPSRVGPNRLLLFTLFLQVTHSF